MSFLPEVSRSPGSDEKSNGTVRRGKGCGGGGGGWTDPGDWELQ